MIMYTLENKQDNTKALNAFREKLEQISHKNEELEWRFPDGERAYFPTYSIETYLGELQIGVPKSWESKIPHFVRFSKESGSLSPDVELNIPLEHNRNVSGLYVEDQDKDEIWLCSRGSFTSFRGQIKREITFTFFNKWLLNIDDAGKEIQVIPVCSLSSSSIADDIATFVTSVQELKSLYKKKLEILDHNPVSKEPSEKSPWEDGLEYEGIKSSGKKENSEYEYLHGPLCNQLKRYLEGSICETEKVVITKNIHVDIAIVDEITNIANVIFEVKTESLPSNQIYTAIGQVFYYKLLYGNHETKLYLVLPLSCKSEKTEQLAKSLNIGVVYGNSGDFTCINGHKFNYSADAR